MEVHSPAQKGEAELVAMLREVALSLASPDDADEFSAPFARFGDARVVLLGEASHGTSEFYRARAAITRRLIEDHGFNIVAVEADWPDASRVDRYVRHRPGGQYDEHVFARFPTWMWRNRQFARFVEWLRYRNDALPVERQVEFRGLDVYSLRNSIAEVLNYLAKADPEAAALARRRYGCLSPFQVEPQWYGRAVLMGERDPCEDAVATQLEELLQRRLDKADDEDLFDATRNAKVVQAAEQYYRLMFRGSTQSWNMRDTHMFETLQSVLDARGPQAKIVVWAHNSHIGDASATEMGWEGQHNIGQLCKQAYGDACVTIGFGTDHGTVAAADDWDEPVQFKTILPSRQGSFESLFHQAGQSPSLTHLHASPKLRQALSEPRLERAIGVVYRPDTELQSHYFKARLLDQFDAYVWFDQTTAVTPLPTDPPHGTPETFPFGL
ncbi:erythromycin esterase family protein [Devosia submarina]|uniref:erythromycin esterase family protein n=1 Tax=Devosia submarina TaxID=1173082 RepID=UPI001FECC2DC|nr:erythromycin esterase family protein [Devosia submarina]